MTVKTEDISHSVQPNIYTDKKNGLETILLT